MIHVVCIENKPFQTIPTSPQSVYSTHTHTHTAVVQLVHSNIIILYYSEGGASQFVVWELLLLLLVVVHHEEEEEWGQI